VVVVVLKNGGRKKSDDDDDDENTEREKSAFETVAEHEGAVEVSLVLVHGFEFFQSSSPVRQTVFFSFFLSRKGSG
jgi:hypothetical protein